MKITINGKNVSFKLSYEAICSLQKKWGFKTLNETYKKIMETFDTSDLDGSIEILVEMSHGEVTFDEAGKWLFDNLGNLAALFRQVSDDVTDPTAELGK